MRRQRPLLVAAAALAAIVVLFVVLRPNDDKEETGTAETTSSTQVTTSATTSTAPTTTAKPAVPARTRVTITVRAGHVIGGIRRVTLPKGALVELVVTADVADEVHLHGYDISRDVAPGAPARLRFKATTSGRFEVELEQRQLQIAEITVRP
jgi:heme/copper-type cytochrome/quinol oxidase subunit 2